MIVWTDLETTGLDERENFARPLEVAIIITDDLLHELAAFRCCIRFNLQRWEMISGHMNQFVRDMHTENGLWNDCESETAVPDEYAAQRLMLDWMNDHVPEDVKPPLGGSTISFDRAWLREFFPAFHDRLHYRNVDVSSIKEAVNRWAPSIAKIRDDMNEGMVKKHRALDDIRDTLHEAQLYKDLIFDTAEVAAHD